MSRYRLVSNLIATSMNLGSTSSSREGKPAPVVLPAENVAAQILQLARRLDRLIKRVQLFSASCQGAPEGVRNELKQLVDLALVELEEGGKALEKFRSEVPETAVPVSLSPLLLEEASSVLVPDATPAQVEGLIDHAAPTSDEPAARGNAMSIALPSYGQLEASYDTMANFADIPEASDLSAILAKLEAASTGDGSSDQTAQVPSEQPRAGESSTRERLLEFEVCRLQRAEENSEPDAPLNSAQETTLGLLCDVEAVASEEQSTVQLLGSDLADEASEPEQLLSMQVTGVHETVGSGANSSASESQNGCAAARATTPSDEEEVTEPDSCAAQTARAESLAPAPTASPRPQSRATPPAFTGAAPANSTIGATGKTGVKKNADQGENTNPLDAISPDNLKAILSLKEELNQVLHEYKPAEVRLGGNS